MKEKKDFYFLRTFRTASSEVWLIDYDNQRVGIIHLHFSRSTFGDIILLREVDDKELGVILKSIDEWLASMVEGREDFIFAVYQAKEIGNYSDIVDHYENAPTRKELKEYSSLVNKLAAKHQDAKGQLKEHVVKDYFSNLNFKSIKADEQFDALKVDIIAENDQIIIYCQVKLGRVDKRKIHDICMSIKGIKPTPGKRTVIGIVADSFPSNVELIKDELETKLGLRIWTIFKSQILNELPQYKRTLS